MPACPRAPLYLALPLLLGCPFPSCSAEAYRQEADEQVYAILASAAKAVTGKRRSFEVERPVDTLRKRLLTSKTEVALDLQKTLDVAAENSREFQRQKESLYRAGLDLTLGQYEFDVRFGGGGSAEGEGTYNEDAQITFKEDLSTSMNTQSGGRLVASFANEFFRSVIGGEGFLGHSILRLTFTQPLLAGFGRRIVREPLTQAERDVVYAMRDYERFRSVLAVRITSDFYDLLSQMDNLQNVRNNHASLVRDRIRLEELVKAQRQRSEGLDQSKQQELVAEDRINTSVENLESSLDRFKITLGLPTDAKVVLDKKELERLQQVKVEEQTLDEKDFVEYALEHRLDYRTIVDEVADAGRRVYVVEDSLRSVLDFSTAIDVGSESDEPLEFDWDNVGWSAGFDLDLALDRLPQRNNYRMALINLDAAIRSREQEEDQIKADIRRALRQLRSTYQSYEIQNQAVKLAERRVERTDFFMQAGRANTTARDVLEAKDSLLAAQLGRTQALVDYAIAKLELLRDLEALPMEPKGLRFDPGLPLPKTASMRTPSRKPRKGNEEK